MASLSDIWEKQYNKLLGLFDEIADINSLRSQYVSESESQLVKPLMSLLEDLDSLAEKDMIRKKDLIASLRTKVTSMDFPYMPNFANMDNLLEADTKPFLACLLDQIIREQYEEIGKLEETVISTDDIVLPANEEHLAFFRNVVSNELDLQTWIIDALDQQMHVTYSQLEVKLSLVIEERERHYREDVNVDEVLEQQVEVDEDFEGWVTLQQPLPKRHKQVHNSSTTLVDHTTHVSGTTNSDHVMLEIDQNICYEGSEYDVEPITTLSSGDTIVPNLNTCKSAIMDDLDEGMCLDVDEFFGSMETEQFTVTSLGKENETLKEKTVYCEAELYHSIATQQDLHNHNNNLMKELSISEQPLQHDSTARNKMSEWKAREEELLRCLEGSKQKLKGTIAESKQLVQLKRDNFESQQLQHKEKIHALKNKLEASEAALRISEEGTLVLAEKRSKLIRETLKMVVSRLISSEEFEENLNLVIDYAIQFGRHLGQIAMRDRHAPDMINADLPYYNVEVLENCQDRFKL